MEFFLYVSEEDLEKIGIVTKGFILRPVPYRWHTLSEQFGFLRRLLNDRLDLMHFTYFSYPVMYVRPFIATVHDLTPLLHKTGRASTRNPFVYEIKHEAFSFILRTQIRSARRVITPSKTVERQIIGHYGGKFEKKTVPIYEGVDYELESCKINKNLTARFHSPFFLYVGNFYPHKNLEKLVKAFAEVKCKEQLVLAGPEDFFSGRLRQLIDSLHMSRKILLFCNPSLPDLKFFYTHARALVHPSISEGFGLPLIEASFFKLPVIASDIPVFRELLGRSYHSFDPRDVRDICEKIQLFSDGKIKPQYSANAAKFSFGQTAQQTLKLYRQVLNETSA